MPSQQEQASTPGVDGARGWVLRGQRKAGTARPTLYPPRPPTACRMVTDIPPQMRRPRLCQASDVTTTKSLSAAKWLSMSPSSASSGRAPCPLNGWGPARGRRQPLQASVPRSQRGPRAEHAGHRCPRTRRGHRRGTEPLWAPSALGRQLCSRRALPGWGAWARGAGHARRPRRALRELGGAPQGPGHLHGPLSR